MIGQRSTYLEVGRCCSAETRQPDSPQPSTSASSCNRFDFAIPLVSTDVYAVPLNRNGRANEASSPRGNLGDEDPGTKSYEPAARRRSSSRMLEVGCGSTVVDEVEGVFFFCRIDDRFPPRVQPTRGWKLSFEFVSRKIAGVEEGACLSFSKLRLSRRYPSPFFLVPLFFPSPRFLVSFVVGNPSIRSSSRAPR